MTLRLVPDRLPVVSWVEQWAMARRAGGLVIGGGMRDKYVFKKITPAEGKKYHSRTPWAAVAHNICTRGGQNVRM